MWAGCLLLRIHEFMIHGEAVEVNRLFIVVDWSVGRQCNGRPTDREANPRKSQQQRPKLALRRRYLCGASADIFSSLTLTSVYRASTAPSTNGTVCAICAHPGIFKTLLDISKLLELFINTR